jgi:hypothetical protein
MDTLLHIVLGVVVGGGLVMMLIMSRGQAGVQLCLEASLLQLSILKSLMTQQTNGQLGPSKSDDG